MDILRIEADADIRVHFRHTRAVVFCAEARQLLALPHQQFAGNAVIEKLHEGQPASLIHLFDHGVHQHIVDALRLDEDLFALLKLHGIIHQNVRQLFYPFILHVLPLLFLHSYLLYINPEKL